MSPLVLAAIAGVAVLLYLRSSRRAPSPAASQPAPQSQPTGGEALSGLDMAIEARARLAEVDLLSQAQAKLNLQRRLDLLQKVQAGVEGQSPKN